MVTLKPFCKIRIVTVIPYFDFDYCYGVVDSLKQRDRDTGMAASFVSNIPTWFRSCRYLNAEAGSFGFRV